LSVGGGRLAYYVFDLLFLNGRDLRGLPLLERKAALAEVLVKPPERLLLSEHLACDSRAFFRQVVQLGCEGIVSKGAAGSYTTRPTLCRSRRCPRCGRGHTVIRGLGSDPALSNSSSHGGSRPRRGCTWIRSDPKARQRPGSNASTRSRPNIRS